MSALPKAILLMGPTASGKTGVAMELTRHFPVELISVADAGHQWPGGVPSPLAQRLGDLPPPSTALNATHTIWEFFAGHHR